jgi:DNA-binding LacI/PurR family transcriptional regulator
VSVRVLDGLIEGLGEHGLGVLLVPGLTAQLGVSDPETAAKVAPVDPLITSAGMDVAVLVWGANGVDDPNLVALQRRGVRVVIGEGPVVDGAPVVGVDDRGGAAAAVQHLVDLGHRRIAEVAMPLGQAGGSRIAGDSGSDAFSGNGGGRLGRVEVSDVAHVVRTSTRDRMVGVRDVVEPVLTWETPASLVEHGRDAAQAILGPDSPLDEPPTAIFAHTDLLAAGVVIGARELGLTVPGDLSVVGFDGIDIPWLAPDVLTSVHQPLRDKGAALGRAVVGLLAGEPPARDTLPVHLVEGTTTAALEPGI